jgi:hypothetical protein
MTMGTKQRSILILIGVFILGGLSGYFGRGIHDQIRWKAHRESRHQDDGKSRFVGYFLSVIKPEGNQGEKIEAILEKWDDSMRALQTRFENESQTGFQGMVTELGPLLQAHQLHRLKEALERFGHRRRPKRSKPQADKGCP